MFLESLEATNSICKMILLKLSQLPCVQRRRIEGRIDCLACYKRANQIKQIYIVEWTESVVVLPAKAAMPTSKCFLSSSQSLFQFSRQPICLSFHCETTVLANRLFLLQCARYLFWPQNPFPAPTLRRTTYAPPCYSLLFLILQRLLLIHSCYKPPLFFETDFAMQSWANWWVI